MMFHQRVYDVHVLLGHPDQKPLWAWPVWKKAAALLTPPLSAARGKVAVRCTQYGEKGGKPLSFGSLGWDDASHQKWTQASPLTGKISARRRFLGAEVWGPSWGACGRENKAPDVYLSVTNELLGAAHERMPMFNPLVLLAVAVDGGLAGLTMVRQAASGLFDIMRAQLSVHKRRPWGYGDDDGFSRSLQDFTSNDLLRGDPHARPPSPAACTAGWAVFKPGGAGDVPN